MERAVTVSSEVEKLTGSQRLMHRWQSSQSRNRRMKQVNQQVFTDCICLECGSEFSVQREGALYVCDRCTSNNL